MGFSLVATVIGGVIGGARWGLAGGIDMPTVSLQEVGTSDVVSLTEPVLRAQLCHLIRGQSSRQPLVDLSVNRARHTWHHAIPAPD
jgi:hypothetical protein